MNLLELYKELYYKENENKSRLGAKLVPMITILVALSTAEVWVINNLLKLSFENFILTLITYGLLALSVVGNIAIIFFFYRAHYNYKYKYIKVSDIEEYNRKLNLTEYREAYSQDELDENLKETIKDMFYEAVVSNQNENNRKIENQNALMVSYLVHFMFLIACFYWITLH